MLARVLVGPLIVGGELRIVLEVDVHGDIGQMLPGPIYQVFGPAAIAPTDELEGLVAFAHGLGKLDRGGDGLLFGEGRAAAVRCFIAELP